MPLTRIFRHCILIAAIGTSGCGGSTGSSASYSLSGTVDGLAKDNTVTLKLNGSSALKINGNGMFSFPSQFSNGASYAITVDVQPAYQRCAVTNGTGTVTSVTISSLVVSCVATPELVIIPNLNSLISIYSLNTDTGALSHVAGSPFAIDTIPGPVVVDPAGRFLFVGSSRYGVWVYAINPMNGRLTKVVGSPFIAGQEITAMAIDPAGRFVYALSGEDKSISALSVDAATGALKANAPAPFPIVTTWPKSLEFHPNGKFAYFVNSSDSTLSAYAVDTATGALTAIAGSPFNPDARPTLIKVHPNGKFAYLTKGAFGEAASISTYRIDATTGWLQPIAGSSANLDGYAATALLLSPDGKYAYVPGTKPLYLPPKTYSQPQVMVFALDPTSGLMSPSPGSPFFEFGAYWQTVSTTGSFGFLAEYSGGIQAVSIDISTGAIKAQLASYNVPGASASGVLVTRPR